MVDTPPLPMATTVTVPVALQAPAARGRRVAAALVNLLLLPGAGHAMVGRRRAAAIWVGTAVALMLAIRWSVWFVVPAFAIRPAAALEVGLRRVAVPRVPHGAATWGWAAAALVGALLVRTVVRSHWVEGFKIPSSGMTPTLQIGDHVFVDKLAYRVRSPELGEVVVYWQEGRQFVGRIVAFGGTTVEVRCGELYLDGAKAARTAAGASSDREAERGERLEIALFTERIGASAHVIGRSPSGSELLDFPDPAVADGGCEPQASSVVPPGTAFLMGDNRDNAADSRYRGAVSLEQLIGPVLSIWWSDAPGRVGDL